jgi:hypothetical protein
MTRLAERRGVTTLALLLQVAVPAYRDVRARVRFSEPTDGRCLAQESSDAEITARVQQMARKLLAVPPLA